MARAGQFEDLKELAREKRLLHKVDTARFGVREMRAIYKAEGIDIHYRDFKGKIKALYMCGDGYYSVALKRGLPDEPKLFSLAHELKHHYRDQDILESEIIWCGDVNMQHPIEQGAEVFASEFIYPIKEFAYDISTLHITNWTPEYIVNLKRNCKAKVSYFFLRRRLEELGQLEYSQYKDVKFQKLEESLYGVPYHKRIRNKSLISI